MPIIVGVFFLIFSSYAQALCLKGTEPNWMASSFHENYQSKYKRKRFKNQVETEYLKRLQEMTYISEDTTQIIFNDQKPEVSPSDSIYKDFTSQKTYEELVELELNLKLYPSLTKIIFYQDIVTELQKRQRFLNQRSGKVDVQKLSSEDIFYFKHIPQSIALVKKRRSSYQKLSQNSFLSELVFLQSASNEGPWLDYINEAEFFTISVNDNEKSNLKYSFKVFDVYSLASGESYIQVTLELRIIEEDDEFYLEECF